MRGKSGNRSTLSNGFWSWVTCEVACEVTCEVTCEVAGLVMQNCSCTTHHLRYVIISLLLGPDFQAPRASPTRKPTRQVVRQVSSSGWAPQRRLGHRHTN